MLELICVICHELFSETDDVYATQCGHIFHQSCISNWLNDSATCPQCRKTCIRTNIHKLYLESAIESSDNANVKVQRSTESAEKEALDLYEEVNLNLKRELEMTANNLDDCLVKLIYLEDERNQVQNDLKEEIERRKNCEERVAELEIDKVRLTDLDHSLQVQYTRVQNDLKNEMKRREEEVAELEKDKLQLKAMVTRLEIENRRAQSELQNKRKGTTEERMAQLEKKIEKEIETREISEKRLAQLEKDQFRPRKDLHNSNQHDANEKAEAVVFGIPQLPNENLKTIFQQLWRAIDCEPPNLKDIYRQQNKPDSPIILKFGSFQERNSILKAMSVHRKKIDRQLCPQDVGITCNSTKKIYIRESLTPQNRVLLQKALRLMHSKQLHSVYTNFGFVYVKQSPTGMSTKIENEEMLNSIARTSLRRIDSTPLLHTSLSNLNVGCLFDDIDGYFIV